MYRVYFDNIEQDVKDIININSVIALTIIREDGITSTEQILREKTEMELQFTGCAYDYICGKIATDRCTEIQFSIEDTDTGISFNGVINVSMCELKIAQRIGKTKIKDNSFSAYIRDYMNTNVSLFASITKDCSNLESALENFVLKKAPASSTASRTVVGFDVLKVLQFLVNYHTDNNIDVVSTYLTTNKYMITTGSNMTLSGTTSEMIYPEISINGLFQELRKKLRLYMGIERYPNGVPYLRIEQEDYFFADTPLISISDVPINLTQSYDIDRNFNSISMGSETTEMADEATEIFYPQKRFIAWNNERYLSCGSCLSNKDSSIDAVSQYIIDSNIIYEALNFSGSDYKYNDSIFLIKYKVESGINTSDRTTVDGLAVYNIQINNETSLANWIDYFGKCITLSSYPKNGFWIQHKDYEISVAASIGGPTTCVGDIVIMPFTGYDNEVTIQTHTGSVYVPSSLCASPTSVGSSNFSYFEALTTADYRFVASVANFRQTNFTENTILVDFRISILVYTDDTFATLDSRYDNTVSGVDVTAGSVNISVDTGIVNISAGQCVAVFIEWEILFDYYPFSMDFEADMIDLRMIADSNSCNQQNDENQNSKPYLVEFDYPLCAEDYLLIKDNKSGYIEIAGNRYWIKELTYKQGLSQLKLMGNSSLC